MSVITTSVVCGVMDRTEHLLRALHTWLGSPDVDELVVVDWSSSKPLWDEELPSDSRLHILRVEEREHWHLSKCLNLGLQVASSDAIIRLDADDLVTPGFLAAHPLAQDSFYKMPTPTPSGDLSVDAGLSGVLYAWRSDLLAVGGYDERLACYGCDDDDLVARLEGEGFEARFLEPRFFSHIPHGDDLRMARSEIPEPGPRPPWASWIWNTGGVGRSIETNRRITRERPWNMLDNHPTLWSIWSISFPLTTQGLDKHGKTKLYFCQEIVS